MYVYSIRILFGANSVVTHLPTNFVKAKHKCGKAAQFYYPVFVFHPFNHFVGEKLLLLCT